MGIIWNAKKGVVRGVGVWRVGIRTSSMRTVVISGGNTRHVFRTRRSMRLMIYVLKMVRRDWFGKDRHRRRGGWTESKMDEAEGYKMRNEIFWRPLGCIVVSVNLFIISSSHLGGRVPRLYLIQFFLS